ncbi:MAG: phytanoyl-CoA dioxygenase family protein, partial [Chloroflexota bacterium]|nr:phytanoyl-CoA dioxygenase family protein [Chloroflexota bacterium]
MQKIDHTQPQYKTMPTQEDLAQLERRLQFHPSTVTNPQVLTGADIEAYNRDGYVKGFRVFEPAEMGEHRAHLDKILAETLAAGGTS